MKEPRTIISVSEEIRRGDCHYRIAVRHFANTCDDHFKVPGCKRNIWGSVVASAHPEEGICGLGGIGMVVILFVKWRGAEECELR